MDPLLFYLNNCIRIPVDITCLRYSIVSQKGKKTEHKLFFLDLDYTAMLLQEQFHVPYLLEHG